SATFTASRLPFYDNELHDILCASQEAWRDQTRRAILLVSQNTNADTDIVYLCQGSTFVLASQIEGAKVIGINCLRPFPTEELLAAVGTSKKVIVLSESTSQLCGEAPLSSEIKGALASSTCEVATVKCIGATTHDIRALIETVESGSSLPSVIGVSFLCENSPYPKHASAMDELERSYPEIKSLSLFCASSDGKNAPREQSRRSPLLESNLWDDPLGSLPRFWNQVGMLCQNSDEDLVTATPILSSNAIPPLTASLRRVESDSSVLPIFDPSSCDGDPTLWMTCPDGSISALVLSSKAILESGIMQAGGNAAALRSIAGGLCKQMVAIAKTNMQPTVGELLVCAFDALIVTEDRRDALQEALSAVITKIGEVPISKTPLFFDKDGANEFLILSVNPDACKSPELIIAATAGHGIEPTSRTPESVSKAHSLQELILKLPDTSGETIHRISQVDGMKLPAIMLSRHCHFAMSAGDAAEAGSGSKLVLRQTLALAEYQLQPRLQEMLNQVETLAIELQEGATKLLAEAIPSGNLEGIAKAIEKSGQDEVDLATILHSITGDDDAPRVDGEAVRMMSSLAEKLKNITIRLTQSSGGLGRARSGMTLTGTATSSWSAVFPWNPFSTPVAVDITNTGCSLAAGLFEGQMQQVLADLNIIRRARLVLENPIKAAHPVEEVDALSIQDLSDSERALCPPMFVVADSASLHRNALSELAWILASDLPIKIIVLGDGIHDVALFGLTSCNAYIAQCSPSHPDQFATSMQEALQFSGPALVSIYKPCPKQHGFAAQDLIAQAALAVETRVCPLFSYNPNSEGVFGRCIDITANPTFEAVLVSDDLVPSAWAATQQRFVDGYYEEEAVIARWQMLQELSGVVTPFDAVARSQQEEAANQHKIDLDSQAKQYEEKIASLRDQYHAEAVASVTSGLISMASQASKPEVNN
ncbi:MAG: hypothetical protein QGF07_04820, partial [Phycisphaerales bacterium]|nr:hypothetical protein [Phycisphaerales bacterium]